MIDNELLAVFSSHIDSKLVSLDYSPLRVQQDQEASMNIIEEVYTLSFDIYLINLCSRIPADHL